MRRLQIYVFVGGPLLTADRQVQPLTVNLLLLLARPPSWGKNVPWEKSRCGQRRTSTALAAKYDGNNKVT